jgi:hypothetical protein
MVAECLLEQLGRRRCRLGRLSTVRGPATAAAAIIIATRLGVQREAIGVKVVAHGRAPADAVPALVLLDRCTVTRR